MKKGLIVSIMKEVSGEWENHQIILGMLIDAIIETSRRAGCIVLDSRIGTCCNITPSLWSLVRVIEIRSVPRPGDRHSKY